MSKQQGISRRGFLQAGGFGIAGLAGVFGLRGLGQSAPREPMAMAGLWESWKSPDGEIVRTVCIVTTGANELMAPIQPI